MSLIFYNNIDNRNILNIYKKKKVYNFLRIFLKKYWFFSIVNSYIVFISYNNFYKNYSVFDQV